MASVSFIGTNLGISWVDMTVRNRVVRYCYHDVLAVDCSQVRVRFAYLSSLISKSCSEDNVEKFGGFSVIAKEGGITAAGVFMVTWVIF